MMLIALRAARKQAGQPALIGGEGARMSPERLIVLRGATSEKPIHRSGSCRGDAGRLHRFEINVM